MTGCDFEHWYAPFRMGDIVRLKGRKSVTERVLMAADVPAFSGAAGKVTEWRDPECSLLARRVDACGQTECWLRADLLERADEILAAEKAEADRVAAEVCGFIRRTDRDGAARAGLSVEAYRTRRHNAGARWDRSRAANRAGGI